MRKGRAPEEEWGKKFQRLLGILRHLGNTQGGVTVPRLAQIFGVEARTIERDISDLRYACFDIQNRRGKGYFLNKPQEIPLQTLQVDEMLSLALANKILQAHGGQGLANINKRAMHKVQAFIKTENLLRTRDLPQSVAVHQAGREHRWLSMLMQAVAAKVSIEFDYVGYQGEPTRRHVDPWTLLYQTEVWYLQGHDHHRGGSRSFRVQRMENVSLTGRAFTVPEHHRAEQAVFHRWDLGDSPKVEVLCRVEPPLARWLIENPVHPSQELDGDHLRLQVSNLERVASWILGLQGLEVLQPLELRSLVRERAALVGRLHLEK